MIRNFTLILRWPILTVSGDAQDATVEASNVADTIDDAAKLIT